MANKNRSGDSLIKNNAVIFGGIAVLLLIVFIGAATFLKTFTQTETYYVLGEEYGDTYPARTEITEDMLEPMIIAEGSAPPNALTLDVIQQSYVFTKFQLNAGDVLTESNAGPVGDISEGVPENWVVTNFSVDADNAAGGRINAGDYFDILVAAEEGSFYPFINVLALDTTVDLSGASSAAAAETDEAYDGQTSQYVVAMSPENAGKLHNLVKNYSEDIKLVIAPKQNEYNKPRLADYSKVFKFESKTNPIWPGTSTDGEVTDSNFTSLERNSAGEPVKKSTSKTGGNSRGDYVDITEDEQQHPNSKEEAPSEATDSTE